MDKQIRRFGVVVIALFLLLFLQLNHIQVLQASHLANAPGNARTVTREFAHPRGVIEAADGTVLAKSVPSKDLYNYQRVYPHGTLYAGVTGYFSLIYGLDGAEKTYDQYLSGRNVPFTHLSDLLAPNQTRVDNVTLTVSPKLQQTAATALGHRIGAVVAIDPATGAILAMYSYPPYDPNALASHDAATAMKAWKADNAGSQPLLDRAYRSRYPPGSTFKVVTSAAVYDHKPQLATKSYPVESAIHLPETTNLFHNYANESCGGMLPELLKVSCDTGFAEVGLDLGGQALAGEAKAFGFDQTPPLDLPAPAQSAFPPVSSFAQNLPALAFSAIGQENVAATPLEMAMVAGAIADQGKIMAPHVMAQVRDNQGNLVKSYRPHRWLQATSAATASVVRRLMVGVVKGGTATGIALPGITLAAKTGTAEIGPGTHNNDDWMIAFGPAGAGQTPSIAVAAVVPDQPPSTEGATVAGPIVKTMLAAALGGK
ncbi:MAG: penicillin-binding transpeptidase domain-containing protein [Acidimicrobiales bacterium]